MNPENRYNPNLRQSVEELRKMREHAERESQEHWPIHDDDLSSFAADLVAVIPGSEQIRFDREKRSRLFIEYIREVLKPEQNKHLVALELGGPGIKLFNGFPEDFFEYTLGVCLEDTKNPLESENQNPKHEVIRGDLFRKNTYQKIEAATHDKGVDLIISRMFGGLEGMSRDPVLWARMGREWYRLLREGGLMLAQFRISSGGRWISETEVEKDIREKIMKEWVEFITKNYSDTLEIQLGEHEFRLLKKEGAPKELPILDSFDNTPVIEKIDNKFSSN
jgi:hypothetical protein